ncbi:MAG: hypothetical protein E3K29_06685 [Candidatus Brocadia sp.]|nr:hypothetical protein [Candidatus Brocadia sp.]
MITTRQKIKIELIKKNTSGFEIARKMGVSRSAIYLTIYGKRKSPRLRKAIADAIDMKVEDLWPTNGNGSRKVHPLPPPAGDNSAERR